MASMKSISVETISMTTISDALKSVDTKKENLRKAFECLQSHSSSLASFTLRWEDLDEHFDSIHKSVEERFKELESKEKQSGKGSMQEDKPSLPAKELAIKTDESESTVLREMKSFCVKMDGMGLRSYIMNHRKEIQIIRDEVAVALQSASDPAKLVLDAMQGVYPLNSKRENNELAAISRTRILLMEKLMVISPHITPQVKEKAKKLAVEWKGKVSMEGENPLEALALLQLLATYGVASEFNIDEILDLLVPIARRKQAIDLCRVLGFTDKIPDFIHKLSSKGKQLDAVKFVYAFELLDKFPPVLLLKGYLNESKKVSQEVRKRGNNSTQSLNEATAKEIAAVKAIIKCVVEHQLESQYPLESLDKLIEQLEKQKADRKRRAAAPAPAPAPAPKPKQQQQQQAGNKRRRPASSNTTTHDTPSVAPATQTHYQPGFLSDRVPPYSSSSAQYGWAGTAPTVAHYMNPSALGGNPPSYGSPSRSHLYSSEGHLAPGRYERSMVPGGYGLLPSYRPSFYP